MSQLKFICGKADLQHALNIVAKAAYNKNIKSILECVHIRAEGENVVIDATDSVMAIRTSVYADVEKEGEAAIPARLLVEIISKFPEGDVTIESPEGTGISITAESSSAKLNEMDAEQFPAFPEIEGKPVSISQKNIKELIAGTSFAVYAGEDRPVLTGLLLETKADRMSMVAIDGTRIARRTVYGEFPEGIKVVIPSKPMKDMLRLMDDDEGNAELFFTDGAAFVALGDTVVYTRLLDGKFLSYENLFGIERRTRVRVVAAQLARSLERVGVMAKEDSNNLIRIVMHSDCIELSSNSEYGDTVDRVPVYLEGQLMKIALNAKLALDIIRAVDDDTILMEFGTSVQNCVVRPLEGDRYEYLIVPVRQRDFEEEEAGRRPRD